VTIAKALVAEIDRRGITQAQAASELGVHPNRVSRWISRGDVPTPDAYKALQRFLSLDPAAFGLLLMATTEQAYKRRGR
jgi:transcriptional regulator with XRE-family HTH domain